MFDKQQRGQPQPPPIGNQWNLPVQAHQQAHGDAFTYQRQTESITYQREHLAAGASAPAAVPRVASSNGIVDLTDEPEHADAMAMHAEARSMQKQLLLQQNLQQQQQPLRPLQDLLSAAPPKVASCRSVA
jgi:hypothetical protein